MSQRSSCMSVKFACLSQTLRGLYVHSKEERSQQTCGSPPKIPIRTRTRLLQTTCCCCCCAWICKGVSHHIRNKRSHKK